MENTYDKEVIAKIKDKERTKALINELGAQSDAITKKMNELNRMTPQEIQKEYEYCLQLRRKRRQNQK